MLAPNNGLGCTACATNATTVEPGVYATAANLTYRIPFPQPQTDSGRNDVQHKCFPHATWRIRKETTAITLVDRVQNVVIQIALHPLQKMKPPSQLFLQLHTIKTELFAIRQWQLVLFLDLQQVGSICTLLFA